MKHLQKTLAMIAFLCLVAQTIRHAYILWLEPRGSALDAYDRPAKEQIAAAASLEALLRSYDTARKQLDLAREEQAKSAQRQAGGSMEDSQKEPFKSEQMLREAVVEWETQSKEIRALRFFWLVGFGLFLSGLLVYEKRNRWFGVALLIAAFSEFVYWTSPTFIGATREFDRLLANKLALSAVSLLLLLAGIRVLAIFPGERDGACDTRNGPAASGG